jgi:type II secretion system protein C
VAVKTSLNITLRGTITVADGRDPRSTAVIEANRGAAASFKVGETFMPNVEITRILHKRIEFLNKDVLEYAEVIEFVKPEGGARVASLTDQPNRVTRSDAPADTSGEIKQDGNNFTIPKSVFDNAISPENLPVLLTQARVVPFWRDGKAEGFKFINIKSGSIFEKLGLRRGDVLKSINGQVPEMQKGFQMLSDLKDESNFTLELERRGVPQTFSYQKT